MVVVGFGLLLVAGWVAVVLAGVDLAGVDLAGVDLPGVDLPGGFGAVVLDAVCCVVFDADFDGARGVVAGVW